jgi:glycosyltransferase involved in cell wall biosynthesis
MDKANRFRIGIIFNFTRGWLGGFYYYQNIINAVDFLEDHEKPEIIIFYNKDYSEYLNELHYPYLQLIPWHFIDIKKGYLLSFLQRKNVFVDDMITSYNLSGIYAVNDNPIRAGRGSLKRTVAAAWFPDLQHKFFPQFFDKKRLWLRELRLRITLKNASDLVVSSHDTVSHFKKFYNIPGKLRIHVLQFVSILDSYDIGDFEQVNTKYKIPRDYFIVSNSFLKHKNHIVVLNALKILKQQNYRAHVVFTGKMEVYTDPDHINQLRKIISENQLESYVSLLGVIPREDQLCIMKNAKAVLQPSKFEGWNTTIEDAKSLQLPIIASGIPVHKEQLGDKGTYFDTEDPNSLAAVLANYSSDASQTLYDDYSSRVKTFARDFLNIFNHTAETGRERAK